MNSYLKWVGGKAQLASELIKLFPNKIERYFEPFVGSAAMFLSYFDHLDQPDIFAAEIEFPEASLNDANASLINCHINVMYLVDVLVYKLGEYEKEHAKNPEEFYKKIRSTVTDLQGDPFVRAMEFIYINKTCFNGIWRVNSKGKFNVPWNKKTEINLVSSRLQRSSQIFQKATFYNLDFDKYVHLIDIKEGDFFFIDPPYIPSSETSNFVSYTEDGWNHIKDNNRLKECMQYIDSAGGKFMMTNSDSSYVKELFGDWNISYIKAHRFVKALKNNENREKVNESIITNY